MPKKTCALVSRKPNAKFHAGVAASEEACRASKEASCEKYRVGKEAIRESALARSEERTAASHSQAAAIVGDSEFWRATKFFGGSPNKQTLRRIFANSSGSGPP